MNLQIHGWVGTNIGTYKNTKSQVTHYEIPISKSIFFTPTHRLEKPKVCSNSPHPDESIEPRSPRFGAAALVQSTKRFTIVVKSGLKTVRSSAVESEINLSST